MQFSGSNTNSIPEFNVKFISCSDERMREVKSFVEEWYDESDSIALQTSGSTGKPKTILAKKAFLRASAKMTINFFDLKKGDRALLCLNTSSIAGKMMIIRAILSEMELLVTSVNSNPLTELTDTVDFAAMVPLQVQETLHVNPDKLKLIRKLIVGGAPIHPTLWSEIVRSNVNAYQTFGMTETFSHIALRLIDLPEKPFTLLSEIRINAEPILTIFAPTLGVDELKTNDIIKLVDERNFYWIGRKDFVINSGGIKIHPEQIEQKLGSFIQSPFFSCGLPDEELGEKHILCVEGDLSIKKEDLIALLNKYEVPKEIYFFRSLHYTHTNKIDRNATLHNLIHARREVL